MVRNGGDRQTAGDGILGGLPDNAGYEPAVSLILANLLVHEKFTPDPLVASALIMASVACAAWPRRRTA
jgi:hypothetical protein